MCIQFSGKKQLLQNAVKCLKVEDKGEVEKQEISISLPANKEIIIFFLSALVGI